MNFTTGSGIKSIVKLLRMCRSLKPGQVELTWRRRRPSSRVAAAERKLRLVNDAQAKTFDIRCVECSQCDRKIVLEGDGDYNIAKWDEHKAECPGQLG